jgi:hypothetical protein
VYQYGGLQKLLVSSKTRISCIENLQLTKKALALIEQTHTNNAGDYVKLKFAQVNRFYEPLCTNF